MKIGIVTVYEGLTNLGSYLQAHALQTVLQEMGHEVFFIEKEPTWKAVSRCVCRLNPKREFLLRFQKCGKYLNAKRLLRSIPAERMEQENIDCLIYGSDEIWNMDNPYFKDPLFWGRAPEAIPKIGYAVSVGAMAEETLANHHDIACGAQTFKEILVRDMRTRDMIGRLVGRDLPLVCDPTFLLPVEKQQKPIKAPKEKYLLVYTYGVDKPMEEHIVRLAIERGLRIVSPCFWHPWCDKVVECEPLQFGTLIQQAEYVFTSTFHGAIFTMLNHKKCVILPARSKVRDVVERMGLTSWLISADMSYEGFVEVMERPFPKDVFEENRQVSCRVSKTRLEEVLRCLEQ